MKKAEYEVVGSWGLETRVYFDFFFFFGHASRLVGS